MPSSRPPQLRRPVIVVVSVVLGVLALLCGPAGPARAYPYASDSGPTLTLPAEPTFVLGQTGTSYVIEADGDPVPAIGVDKLPAGLRLTSHADGSATIEGTATGPVGDMIVEVTAQNAAGASYERLTVTIQQAPAFRSRGPVTFVAGELATRVIRTVGFPAAGIGLEGELPAGLTFTDNGDGTASISGTPVDGPTSSPVTLTAVNVVSDVSLTTTVQVVSRSGSPGPPVFVSLSTGPRRAP
ncbi:MAG TPA: hypothetical protein VM428_10480 [Microlunatus sp.]|nr:hypothetical protein [Microlunatus sp.]